MSGSAWLEAGGKTKQSTSIKDSAEGGGGKDQL